MAKRGTAIEWTEFTWNPAVGCRRVSPECENCYAETVAERIVLMSLAQDRTTPYADVVRWADGAPRPRWNGQFRAALNQLGKPLGWGGKRLIFPGSMTDLFGFPDPEYIAAIHGVMAVSGHTFQALTKRPEEAMGWQTWAKAQPGGPAAACIRAALELRDDKGQPVLAPSHRKRLEKALDAPPPWPLPNVWLGVSVGHPSSQWRLGLLSQLDAALRWVSVEPLIGPVSLWGDRYSLDWAVVGGESGDNARPMAPRWARAVRDDCQKSGIPFLFKQWGQWAPVEVEGAESVEIEGERVWRQPKKSSAGRALDGVVWDQYPHAAAA